MQEDTEDSMSESRLPVVLKSKYEKVLVQLLISLICLIFFAYPLPLILENKCTGFTDVVHFWLYIFPTFKNNHLIYVVKTKESKIRT